MIYLNGYFGASNVGDEAISKIIGSYIRSVIPPPEELSKPVKAVVIGGGEYDSWMIEGVTSPLFATGVGLVRDMVGFKRGEELKRFRQLWVRTHDDFRVAEAWGLKPLQGIDSVTLMEPTEEGFKDRDIIIPDWKEDWRASIDFREFHKPVCVPFHPYEKDQPIETFTCFDDPQRVLNSFVGARRVITWGRLHPQIMAFIAGVPCIDRYPNSKTLAWQEMTEKYSLSEMRSLALRMIMSVKDEIDNL